MKITMKDVAKKAGVVQQTVSDVLNEKWKQKGISERTKDRILKVVRELNYSRNNIARSLATGKTNMLGLVFPCVTYSFFPEVTRAVEEAARKHGFQVILCHSDDDVKRETEDIHLLMHQRVAGLIVVPAHERNNNNIFRQLQEDKVPFVLIDKYLKGLRCNFVGTDDRTGAREAVSYLIKLGHRRIGHIPGAPKSSTTDERMAGYKEILIENGITIYPEWIVADSSWDKSGYATAKQLLQLKENRPTAIFAASDLFAIGALKAISEAGLKVPQDISLVGFADIKMASELSVPLTTIRQPARDIGRRAVEILVEEINNNNKDNISRVFLPPSLIIRKSCGSPPK